jgi:hypothetical protein
MLELVQLRAELARRTPGATSPRIEAPAAASDAPDTQVARLALAPRGEGAQPQRGSRVGSSEQPWAPASAPLRERESWGGVDLPLAAVCLWCSAAAAALLGLWRSRLRLARELRGRREVVGGPLYEEWRRLCSQLDARGLRVPRSRLWIAPDLEVPLGLGWRCADVYLPERVAEELDPAQRRALLAHELGHAARRDALWLLCCGWIEGLFFFQPLNRLARRELAHVFELASDEWAARLTGDRLALASCLTQVAAWMTRAQAPLSALGMVGSGRRCRSRLGQRVERLLEAGESSERDRSRFREAALVLATLALASGVAPGVSAPSSADQSFETCSERGLEPQADLDQGAPASDRSPDRSLERARPWAKWRAALAAFEQAWLGRLRELGASAAPSPTSRLLAELDLALRTLLEELAELESELCSIEEPQRLREVLADLRTRIESLAERRERLAHWIHLTQRAEAPGPTSAAPPTTPFVFPLNPELNSR